MPPKIKYTEDDIIDAAYSVVRKYGWKNCTARSIATELGSSTMPIYSYVESMADLKQKVIEKAVNLMIDYQTRVKTDIDFLDMGVGYVLFAKEEKNLFRLMFKQVPDDLPGTGNNPEISFEPFQAYTFETLLNHLSDSEILADFSREEKETIMHHAWIYSHGLAIIINNGLRTDMDESHIISTLKDFGKTLITGFRAKRLPGKNTQ
jgi:AcrR family transcriptional regulator